MAALCCLTFFYAAAQDDELFVMREATLDSALYGRNIFSVVTESRAGQGKVTIEQPGALVTAMSAHKAGNSERTIPGYRVRIFFDNSRNARAMSQQVADNFSALYPGTNVYREYENPYFKVTVGNFRTKGEATKFMNSIKGQFPSVFLVKENINYPSF